MTFFDRIARRYDRTFAPDAAATGRDVRALVEGVTGVALDLGCGTGRAFPHLVAAGLSVIAVDASLPMLEVARKRASSARVALLHADMYARLPLADGSIDAVLALHSVLAHPPHDPHRAWAAVGREIARVARPGALVAIDVPDPRFAAASMRPLGGDRFLYVDGDVEIEAVIPPPEVVVAALGLPLAIAAGPLGPRAIGRLTRPSSKR